MKLVSLTLFFLCIFSLPSSEKIRTKHPDRIAIICEKANNSHLPDIDRKKYLVPPDLTMGQFVYVVRKVIWTYVLTESLNFYFRDYSYLLNKRFSCSSTVVCFPMQHQCLLFMRRKLTKMDSCI